jgi:hypothetical protein
MKRNFIVLNIYYLNCSLKGFTRNDLVFNKQAWLDVKTVLRRILGLKPIFKEEKMKEEEEEEMVIFHLEEEEPEIIEEIHTWVAG